MSMGQGRADSILVMLWIPEGFWPLILVNIKKEGVFDDKATFYAT